MKVQATDVSKRFKLKIKELGRIANPGEVFEVTRERFVVLNGANQFKSIFVTRYIEPEPAKEETEPVKEEAKIEEVVQAKPKKRGRKKKEALDERDKSAE